MRHYEYAEKIYKITGLVPNFASLSQFLLSSQQKCLGKGP